MVRSRNPGTGTGLQMRPNSSHRVSFVNPEVANLSKAVHNLSNFVHTGVRAGLSSGHGKPESQARVASNPTAWLLFRAATSS
jgi:hypothetical protein